MQKNPFKPKYFIEPNIEREMKEMHKSEYIAYQDYIEDVENESVFAKEESVSQEKRYEEYSEDDQKFFKEIEKGSFAHVNELTSLSPAIAKLLTHHLKFLSLAGVTMLHRDAAQYLGKHHGKLYLSGLTHFEFGVAEALGNHDGYLDLARLETILPEDARALARQKGELRLSSLRLSFDEAHIQESEAIFDAFLKHEGEIFFSPELQDAYEAYRSKKQNFKEVV